MTRKKSASWNTLKFIIPIPVIAALLIAFSCQEEKSEPQPVNEQVQKSDTSSQVLYSVEVMPVFGESETDLVNFIVENVHYPEVAKEAGIQGKVYVSFVVNETGGVQDVKVIRGVNVALDSEAIRVVQSTSGKWHPGMQENKAVKVAFVIPITFKLN